MDIKCEIIFTDPETGEDRKVAEAILTVDDEEFRLQESNEIRRELIREIVWDRFFAEHVTVKFDNPCDKTCNCGASPPHSGNPSGCGE